jgi:hypothetical protein
MPQVTLEVSPEEIRRLVFQLPPDEFLSLADTIQNRAETIGMMRLAETGFREWHEEEELYAAEAETR